MLYKTMRYEENYTEFKLPIPQLTSRYNGLARNLEHEFIGHVLLKLTDAPYDRLSTEYEMEGPIPTEAKLGNIIRREIGVPERKSYTQPETYKLNRNDDTAMIIEFGYYNGSNEPNLDVDRSIRSNEFNYPPPKYPKNEGDATLTENTFKSIIKVNCIIKLNYDVQEKKYNFI